MSTLPGYVWAMALIGLIGTIASICVMLWAGALGAGLGRRVAARMAGGVAICSATVGFWLVRCSRVPMCTGSSRPSPCHCCHSL